MYHGYLRIGSRQAPLDLEMSLSPLDNGDWQYQSKLRSSLGDTDDTVVVNQEGRLIHRNARQHGANLKVEYRKDHLIVESGKHSVDQQQLITCEQPMLADGPAEPHLLSLKFPLTDTGFRQNLIRFDSGRLACERAVLINKGLDFAPLMGNAALWHLEVFRESDLETPLITYYLRETDPQVVVGINDRSVGGPGDCLLVALREP